MKQHKMRKPKTLQLANGGDPLMDRLKSKLADGTLTARAAALMGEMQGRNQSNDTQRYSIDTQAATAKMNDATQRYGQDSSAATSRYGVDAGVLNNALNNQTSRYNADNQNATTRYGVDAGVLNNATSNATSRYNADNNNATQLGVTGMNNATSRYNADNQNATSRYNNDAQNVTTQRGQDASVFNNNVDNATTQRGQDVSAYTQRYGTDASRDTARFYGGGMAGTAYGGGYNTRPITQGQTGQYGGATYQQPQPAGVTPQARYGNAEALGFQPQPATRNAQQSMSVWTQPVAKFADGGEALLPAEKELREYNAQSLLRGNREADWHNVMMRGLADGGEIADPEIQALKDQNTRMRLERDNIFRTNDIKAVRKAQMWGESPPTGAQMKTGGELRAGILMTNGGMVQDRTFEDAQRANMMMRLERDNTFRRNDLSDLKKYGTIGVPTTTQAELQNGGEIRAGIRMASGGIFDTLKGYFGGQKKVTDKRIDAVDVADKKPVAPPPPPPPPPENSRVTKDNPAGIQFKRGGQLRMPQGTGGPVPGTGEGDKVDAKYEPGEFVVSNDMLAAEPELRPHLRKLRKQVLAAKGMTPQQADAKAMMGTVIKANDAVETKPTPEELQALVAQIPGVVPGSTGPTPSNKYEPLIPDNEFTRNVSNSLNALGGMGVMASVPLKTGSGLLRLAAPERLKLAAPSRAAADFIVGTEGVAQVTKNTPALLSEVVNPVATATNVALQEGAQANKLANATRAASLANAARGESIDRLPVITPPAASKSVSTAPDTAETQPKVAQPAPAPAQAQMAAGPAINPQTLQGSAPPADLVKGTNGRMYLPGAITAAEHEAGSQMVDSVKASLPKGKTMFDANPEQLDTYNKGIAQQGYGIKVSRDANGGIVMSNSTTPEKMAYVDAKGNPTTDYSSTKQYADGVAFARQQAALADKMESDRKAQEAEWAVGQRANQLANLGIKNAWDKQQAQRSLDVALSSGRFADPAKIAAAQAQVTGLSQQERDNRAAQESLGTERQRAQVQMAQLKAADRRQAGVDDREAQQLDMKKAAFDMQVQDSNELKAARQAYANAKTPEEKKAAEQKLVLLGGKEPKQDKWIYHPEKLDPLTGQQISPAGLVNELTGEVRSAQVAGTQKSTALPAGLVVGAPTKQADGVYPVNGKTVTIKNGKVTGIQ